MTRVPVNTLLYRIPSPRGTMWIRIGLYLPRAIIIVICIPIQWSSTASARAAAHLNKQLNFTNSYFGIPNMWSVSFANTLATIRTSDAYLNGHEEIMGLVIKVALDGMQIRHKRRE